MDTATMTDEDVEAIEQRLRERRMRQLISQPKPPAPGTPEHDWFVQDERKRQERIAAHEAMEAEAARERAAYGECKRAEWHNNAPRRAEAKAELACVENELAERQHLLSRQSELLRLVRYPYDAAGARQAEREESEAFL
jgi:hypothetical protein